MQTQTLEDVNRHVYLLTPNEHHMRLWWRLENVLTARLNLKLDHSTRRLVCDGNVALEF